MNFIPRSQDKVLVIGNGPTVVDKLNLDKISEYDIIVRINRGFFEGIDKYQSVIGTKTDLLYIHDGFCTGEWFNKRSAEMVTQVFVVIPNFKSSMSDGIKFNYPQFEIVPKGIEESITKEYNFEGRWPTTGLECLLHLSELYNDITIVGFDNNTTEGSKYTNYHFYKHTDKRTMDDMKKSRPDHKFKLERVILDSMIQKKVFKVL
tara:strand:+ start:102 stop:716 length:615 start_codon:yes stop_codon:yes gene_type:complete